MELMLPFRYWIFVAALWFAIPAQAFPIVVFEDSSGFDDPLDNDWNVFQEGSATVTWSPGLVRLTAPSPFTAQSAAIAKTIVLDPNGSEFSVTVRKEHAGHFALNVWSGTEPYLGIGDPTQTAVPAGLVHFVNHWWGTGVLAVGGSPLGLFGSTVAYVDQIEEVPVEGQWVQMRLQVFPGDGLAGTAGSVRALTEDLDGNVISDHTVTGLAWLHAETMSFGIHAWTESGAALWSDYTVDSYAVSPVDATIPT